MNTARDAGQEWTANDMDDTIYRGKAIDTAHLMRKVCDTDNIDDYHDLIVGALEVLPVAKPTGKWKYISAKHPQDYFLQCPFCSRKFWYKHNMPIEPLRWNYCPFCGAPMEGLQ